MVKDMKQQKSARMHRFRDSVAISFDDTETLYLPPALARQLSEELARYAADVEAVRFTKSTLGTVNLQGEELSGCSCAQGNDPGQHAHHCPWYGRLDSRQ